MNKNIRKSFITIILIILFIFGFYKLNTRIKIIDLTSIKVKTEKPLDNQKVKVFQGFFTINRKNDSVIFDNNYAKLVYDKHDVGKIITEYGENDFLVIYDSLYYFQFSQACTNDNDYYQYKLKLYKKGENIYLKCYGDGMNFERRMNLISDANKLRCNVPIDENKGRYNGIELN